MITPRTKTAPEVMSWLELAEYLNVGIGNTAFLNLRRDGLPGFRLGKLWRFQKSAVDKWIAERTTVEKEQL